VAVLLNLALFVKNPAHLALARDRRGGRSSGCEPPRVPVALRRASARATHPPLGTDLPDALPLCAPDCLRLPPLVLWRSLGARIFPRAWRCPSWKHRRERTPLPQPPARFSLLAWPSKASASGVCTAMTALLSAYLKGLPPHEGCWCLLAHDGVDTPLDRDKRMGNDVRAGAPFLERCSSLRIPWARALAVGGNKQ
jgi:hypothetical protein